MADAYKIHMSVEMKSLEEEANKPKKRKLVLKFRNVRVSEDDKEGVTAPNASAFVADDALLGSDQLPNVVKRKKKDEKSPAEISSVVEHIFAELEVAAEDDAQLNRESQPAVNKLKKLPLLREVLSKRNLQEEFLDHGVLGLLKNWLEPLPDGSFPNTNVRTAVLEILAQLPIDLNRYDRREQVKKSGIGKVVKFFSKTSEETTSNRRLAKELVDRWSRLIFSNSTRFQDPRSDGEDEKTTAPYRRPPSKTLMIKAARLDFDTDDIDDFSGVPQSGCKGSLQLPVSRPEALPLDFAIRPQSKIDCEQVRARSKLNQDHCRQRISKNLRKLKDPRKKQLQAFKPTARFLCM